MNGNDTIKKMKQIGKNIDNLRNERNITQRQLASDSGITEVSMSRYVAGERCPNLMVAEKMARVLNVSIDELVGYRKPMNYELLKKDFIEYIPKLTNEQKAELVLLITGLKTSL